MTLLVCIYYFIALVGFSQLAIAAYNVLYFAHKHLLRRKLDLLQRYGGKGVWAVVTGASDGIGAEYCKLLAEDGFNVVLISRTLSKLQAVEAACKKANPTIQTKLIQADFSQKQLPLEFYQDIHKQC